MEFRTTGGECTTQSQVGRYGKQKNVLLILKPWQNRHSTYVYIQPRVISALALAIVAEVVVDQESGESYGGEFLERIWYEQLLVIQSDK
jgi:hypothetical protein